MNKLVTAAVLVTAILAPGFLLGEKKPQEPFYRKYLVPGNALDDKIVAQEKLIEANPNSADLRNDFGNLLAARRFPKEARKQYEMAMKLDKNHFLAPYNLGLLYEEEGEIGKAISAYEKSIDRNRGFPASRFRLGRLYERRGQDGNAVAQYARALQIDPGMRDPKRNPLIVDTRLLDRVSLENYPRDMAVAAMASDVAYSNPSMARKLPLDRTLSSEDLAPAPTPAPGAAPGAAPPGRPTPVKVISQPNPNPNPNPGRRDVIRPVPGQNPNINAAPTPPPDLVVLPEQTEPPTEEAPPPPPPSSYPRGAPPPQPTPTPD